MLRLDQAFTFWSLMFFGKQRQPYPAVSESLILQSPDGELAVP